MTSAEGPGAPVRLLLVAVGGRRLALALAEVHGVQAAGAGAAFRGAPLPVVDGRRLLGPGADAGGGPPAALVIVGAAGAEVGLAVDRVEGFVDVAEVRELPQLVAPFVRGVFRGVATPPDGDVLVVDAAALAGVAAAGFVGRGGEEA